jgi:hypothetical protein
MERACRVAATTWPPLHASAQITPHKGASDAETWSEPLLHASAWDAKPGTIRKSPSKESQEACASPPYLDPLIPTNPATNGRPDRVSEAQPKKTATILCAAQPFRQVPPRRKARQECRQVRQPPSLRTHRCRWHDRPEKAGSDR